MRKRHAVLFDPTLHDRGSIVHAAFGQPFPHVRKSACEVGIRRIVAAILTQATCASDRYVHILTQPVMGFDCHGRE